MSGSTDPSISSKAGSSPFRADERQRFLDFQRQMRGLLAIVRSIIRRMAESSTSVEDFAAHLEGRLGALARIQGFLLRAPGAPVDLEELVRAEFLAQTTADEQFELSGPRILLSANEAGTVGLALHELATNSIKFGALSSTRGRVHVGWQRRACAQGRATATLEWRERSEHVIPAASDKGFGFELIEQTLPYELGGTSSIILHPGGLVCSLAEESHREGIPIISTTSYDAAFFPDSFRGNPCLRKPVNFTVLVQLVRNNAHAPQQA